MSDAQRKPTPADPASPEPFEARPEQCAAYGGDKAPDPTDRYVAMLDELAELGMALAREMVADAREEIAARRAARAAAASPRPNDRSAGDPGADPEAAAKTQAARDRTGLAFDRLTRALRLCVALSIKLQRDRAEGAAKDAAKRAAADEARKPRLRNQVKRLVMEAVKRRDKSDTRPEHLLLSRMCDRAEHDDIERDLTRYPLSVLIARICRDLGVEPPWDLWETEHWATEEARLKSPGSPYAKAAKAEPAKTAPAEPGSAEPETAEAKPPEPAAPEPERAEPERAEPERADTEPDEPKPAELKPPEAEPPEVRPTEAPPNPPPKPAPRGFDRRQPPSPEIQRANEEHAARVRARYYLGM